MVAMVIIALISGAFGAIVWAVNKHRQTFGVLLPAGVAVTVSLILWMILMAVGLDKDPATAWMPWIFSLLAGFAAALAVGLTVGKNRYAAMIERENKILSIR